MVEQARKESIMEENTNIYKRYFGVITTGQSYLNLIYLLLAFPLGLFYFLTLVVLFAISIPMTFFLIGFLFLLLVFIGWYAFIVIERQLTIWLLRVDVPPIWREDPTDLSAWEKVKGFFTNPVTWKGLVYLLLKFPLGLLTFVITITLIALSFTFLVSPIAYNFVPVQVYITDNLVWYIDTLGESLLAFLMGAVLIFVSMHIFNGLAWLWGHFARVMLGSSNPKESILAE